MTQVDYLVLLYSDDVLEMDGQLDPPPRGLAVNDGKVGYSNTRNVTHIPSGLALGCFPSEEQAVKFMRSVIDIIDWSMSEVRIKALANIKEIHQQVRKLEKDNQ